MNDELLQALVFPSTELLQAPAYLSSRSPLTVNGEILQAIVFPSIELLQALRAHPLNSFKPLRSHLQQKTSTLLQASFFRSGTISTVGSLSSLAIGQVRTRQILCRIATTSHNSPVAESLSSRCRSHHPHEVSVIQQSLKCKDYLLLF